MKMQGRRLTAARIAAGFRSAREAAISCGWKVSSYSAHEGGRRTIGQDDAEKYARIFRAKGANVTAREILFDGDSTIPAPLPDHPPILRFAPVLGIARSGAWIEVDDSMQAEFAPVPYVPTSYPHAEQFAYKIAGHSTDLAGILDGDYVICVPYFVARSGPKSKDMVIVERRDGERLERSCKRLVLVGDGYELRPESRDPRHLAIIVPAMGAGKDVDGHEIDLVGLVVGKYTPF